MAMAMDYIICNYDPSDVHMAMGDPRPANRLGCMNELGGPVRIVRHSFFLLGIITFVWVHS
jgi:hypothetical protein